MTPEARHILTLLRDGHALVRHPQGWRVTVGAGFERVGEETARELLASPWVIAHHPYPSLTLTEQGRTALEEP